MKFYPVASLYPTRYGVGKTTLYNNYFKKLGIIPISLEGYKQTFLNEEQLTLLDSHYQVLEDAPVLEFMEIEETQVEPILEAPQQEIQAEETAIVAAQSQQISPLESEESNEMILPDEQADFLDFDSVSEVVTETDLVNIDQRAQRRAGALEVIENYATLNYKANGDYTDTEIRRQVENSRQILNNAIRGKNPVQDPKKVMERLRMMMQSKAS